MATAMRQRGWLWGARWSRTRLPALLGQWRADLGRIRIGRTAVGVALAAALLSVTGCTADPAGQPTAASSPSPGSSTSPSPSTTTGASLPPAPTTSPPTTAGPLDSVTLPEPGGRRSGMGVPGRGGRP